MSQKTPSNLVTVERRPPIAIVRYDNTPAGTITNKGAALLHTAIEPLLAEPAVRAVILTGSGDIFIRHADVSQILRAGDALASGQIEPESFVDAPFPRLCRLLDSAPKPVIAAINGTCMGGGLEIALACTLRVAGGDVSLIGLPESRIGIFPGCGGTQRLTAIMGLSRARLFMIDGAVVSAQQAHALGLVDELADNALDGAIALAERLAQREPAAVAAILQLTRPAIDADLAEEHRAFGKLLQEQPGARERLQAFAEGDATLDQLP